MRGKNLTSLEHMSQDAGVFLQQVAEDKNVLVTSHGRVLLAAHSIHTLGEANKLADNGHAMEFCAKPQSAHIYDPCASYWVNFRENLDYLKDNPDTVVVLSQNGTPVVLLQPYLPAATRKLVLLLLLSSEFTEPPDETTRALTPVSSSEIARRLKLAEESSP